MISRISIKSIWTRSTVGERNSLLPTCLYYKIQNKPQTSRHYSSSYSSDNSNNDNDSKLKNNGNEENPISKPTSTSKKNHISTTTPLDMPSFMPVVNIPVAELAHNAFYAMHRPLLGLSIPRPFLAGNMIGQIEIETKDNNAQCSEQVLLQYMTTLRPFEPPLPCTSNVEESIDSSVKATTTTTTITVQIDPSRFLNHNNNHDDIADYLTAMQEKLGVLYDEKAVLTNKKLAIIKKTRRLRRRKGFFEKN